jgi:putative sugar O-methyltransferase
MKRLIKIYHLSKNHLKKYFELHNSVHWQEFNRNKIINLKNLYNFRGSLLSRGLDTQQSFSFDFLICLKNLVGENFLLKNILKRNIGNSNYIYKLGDYYFDYNQLVLIKYFKDLKKYLMKSHVRTVCEIGGGFGQFGELILNNKNAKLILIDLPLSNLISAYYLIKNFPKKKFFLYDDYTKKGPITNELISKYDVFILPPNLKLEKNVKIDFFINMRSMMEMTQASINNYFNFIHVHASKNSYFFNLNRFHKLIGKDKISFENFPYDKNWDVLDSGHGFQQDWIYYVLAQRKFEKFTKNIKLELNQIKEKGKKFNLIKNFFLLIILKIISNFVTMFLKFLNFIFKKNFMMRISSRIINFYK